LIVEEMAGAAVSDYKVLPPGFNFVERVESACLRLYHYLKGKLNRHRNAAPYLSHIPVATKGILYFLLRLTTTKLKNFAILNDLKL
jgi:hypothetical protein